MRFLRQRSAHQGRHCHGTAATFGGLAGPQHRAKPGRGGQLARSAGSSASFTSREGVHAFLRLKSGETRKVHVDCRATIGELANDNTICASTARPAPSLARHPPDGARSGDEPGRSPARRRRGQVRSGQSAPGVSMGMQTKGKKTRPVTSARAT